MLDLYEELRGLVKSLSEEGVEYSLCGALALAVHGITRATVDIDLMIRPEAVEQVEKIAEGRGYVFRAKPMRFAQGAVEIQRLSKPDPDTGDVLSLDLLLVTPPLEAIWQERRTRDWDGVDLTVLTAEGLIALKRLRDSDQDRADIARLEELGGES